MSPYSYQSYYPQQQQQQQAAAYSYMAKGAMQSAPTYGQPGSFAGRKSMQPPGGFSTLSLGDNSGYSPYAQYGSYQSGAPSPAAAASPSYYSSQQGYNSYQQGGADLSSQLGMAQAMRRPPSSGRREGSDPYGAQQSSYSSPYQYGASSAAYGGAQGAGYSSYSPSSAPAYPASKPAYPAASAYGGGGGSAYGQYASSSPYSSPYGAGVQQSYGSQYGGGNGYGGAAAPTSGGYGNMGGGYVPSAAASAVFIPGQKGQFCGKIIMQPPGGKTTLNIFG